MFAPEVGNKGIGRRHGSRFSPWRLPVQAFMVLIILILHYLTLVDAKFRLSNFARSKTGHNMSFGLVIASRNPMKSSPHHQPAAASLAAAILASPGAVGKPCG